MKKLILLFALVCVAFAGSAQKRLLTNVNPTETEKQAAEEEKEKHKYGNGGVSFSYLGVDGGWGLGIRLNFSGFFLQYDNMSGDNEYMDTETWMIKLGYSYRIWMANRFYIQLPVGVGYGHSKVSYKGSKDKDSSGDGLLTFNPAIGLRLYKGFSIEAGYNWDFTKFKFDKDHRLDYFTVGINIVY